MGCFTWLYKLHVVKCEIFFDTMDHDMYAEVYANAYDSDGSYGTDESEELHPPVTPG